MRARKEGHLDHGCRLCQIKPIKKFKYWKIIDNKYPWDLIAKTNHILVTKRHTTNVKLNSLEKKELESLKANYINKNYGIMMEATDRKKSIPSHAHIHLIVLK